MNQKNGQPAGGAEGAAPASEGIRVRLADYGECPYLPGRRWTVLESGENALSPAAYGAALQYGWRRSGTYFYRTVCHGCRMCVPIRLDALSWHPSPSQKRLQSRNADVVLSVRDTDFSEERFDLYLRYLAAQHGRSSCDRAYEIMAYQAGYCAGFVSALRKDGIYPGPGQASAPGPGSAVTEYRLRASGDLVATGYIDILPDGISSVYFAFDPGLRSRSLGTWSVGRELELVRELGKRYYYLGFWVPGSPKMDYKAKFRPFEMAPDGEWTAVADRETALAALRDRPGFPEGVARNELYRNETRR